MLTNQASKCVNYSYQWAHVVNVLGFKWFQTLISKGVLLIVMEFAWHSKMSSHWSPGQRIFCSSFLRVYFSAKCGIYPLPRKVGEWPLLTSSHWKTKASIPNSRELEKASCLEWSWVMTCISPETWWFGGFSCCLHQSHRTVRVTPEGHWAPWLIFLKSDHIYFTVSPLAHLAFSGFPLLHSFFF